MKERASASPGVRNQYNEKGTEMKEWDYSNVENISQIFPRQELYRQKAIYDLRAKAWSNKCIVFIY